MALAPRIKQMIKDLDAEARQELTAAAAAGRFDDLEQMTPIAKEIAVLLARWCPEVQSAATGVAPEAVRRERSEPRQPNVPRATQPRSAAPKLTKTDYPRFLREKDELVKLGWSPREKGPYEHRVSKCAVDSVTSAVATNGKAGTRFAIDEIATSLARAKVTGQIPSYQIYAVFAWLKWAGMVLQHGRQGYTVVRPQTFVPSVEAAWQSLPQR